MSACTGYIGTYTKGESKGIYRFTLDRELSKIRDVKLAASLGNPTYVAIGQDNHYLYSVINEGDSGGVAAFSITDQSGGLKLLNSQLEKGASPCYVSVDRENKHVISANYHKGTVELYEVNSESGMVEAPASIIQHTGSGPNKGRQEKPHVHFSEFTPDGYIAVIDLGIDRLITYEIKNRVLSEVSSFSVKPGSGPRHLEFHPNGNFAYLMTEISSEVIALGYNNGSFSEIQSISAIPGDFSGNNQGSAIHVTSDGRFVYVSNRGHNSIAVFSVNQDSGRLTFVEHISTEGNWPRDFMFDPTERFLVASNQESGNLVLYSRDAATGKLTLLQSDISVPHPVCIRFLHE